MVVDGYRKIALGLVLSDDILVKMFLNLLGFRNALGLEVWLFGFGSTKTISHRHLISLGGTVFTYASIHTRYQESHFTLGASTEITFFLCHSLQ